MFSSCLQDNGPWGGPCSPCPIHVSLPVGLGQMEGPPACVMLDALLLAGPIFVSDCLFPESQMLSPDLNSAQVLRGHGEELAADPWAWGCCCTQHPSPGHQGCPAGSLASCKSDFSPPGTNRVRFFSTTIPFPFPSRAFSIATSASAPTSQLPRLFSRVLGKRQQIALSVAIQLGVISR